MSSNSRSPSGAVAVRGAAASALERSASNTSSMSAPSLARRMLASPAGTGRGGGLGTLATALALSGFSPTAGRPRFGPPRGVRAPCVNSWAGRARLAGARGLARSAVAVLRRRGEHRARPRQQLVRSDRPDEEAIGEAGHARLIRAVTDEEDGHAAARNGTDLGQRLRRIGVN